MCPFLFRAHQALYLCRCINTVIVVCQVIEAVYENLDLKQTVFRQLDSFCKPEAILASNTSYIRIEKVSFF